MVVVLVIVEADMKKRGRMEMLRRRTGRANACALWSIQRLTAAKSWAPILAKENRLSKAWAVSESSRLLPVVCHGLRPPRVV